MKGKQSWATFIRKTKNPELPVVLLEDLGALVGLVIALSALSLTVVTGNADFDGIGTIAIGALLVVIAIVLAREMKSLLIGESAAPQVEDTIRRRCAESPDVSRLIHLRTQHLGPEELLIAAKLDFQRDMSMEELATAIDRLEADIRGAVPQAAIIYIEPDLARST